jgi:hypothetical protein
MVAPLVPGAAGRESCRSSVVLAQCGQAGTVELRTSSSKSALQAGQW